VARYGKGNVKYHIGLNRYLCCASPGLRLGSVIAGLTKPEGSSPAKFLLSVLVTKIGTAIAFVLLFYFARDSLSGQWLLYAFIWWLIFLVGEIGQTIGPNYSWKEAIAGMISETIYLPISAYLTNWLIG